MPSEGLELGPPGSRGMRPHGGPGVLPSKGPELRPRKPRHEAREAPGIRPSKVQELGDPDAPRG